MEVLLKIPIIEMEMMEINPEEVEEEQRELQVVGFHQEITLVEKAVMARL
jgi:hypothetical protein